MKPNDARSGKLASGTLLIVGLGLLAGAGIAYFYIVERPKAWPTIEAVVVSSRVVNPSNPSQHQPEIVFRYTLNGVEQQTPVVSSWSSSSYDSVRRYVDRYPAGSTVTLAVNPSDPSDLRYELGATWVNLIGPGILGVLGAIFTTTGVVTLVPRWRRPRADAAANARILRRVATTFTIIGAVIVGLGIFLTSRNAEMLREWPTVEGEVVGAAIVSRSTTSTRGSSSPLYDIQVTFAYTVDRRPYQSETTTGMSSTSRSRVADLLKQFAKGTRHPIRHRPDDPNVIRFDVSRLSIFAMPVGMLLIGLIFLGFGVLFLRFGPQP